MAVIQNATAMAQLDITNANNQTKIAVENAKSFSHGHGKPKQSSTGGCNERTDATANYAV